MYALGIDLGTTYTAASTWRNGHAEISSLGSRAAAIPSVVLFRDDETFLTGESASRRGLSEPHRVAREFKRRLGDTTPILLGGVPYSAEALMAKLLKAVVERPRPGALLDDVVVRGPEVSGQGFVSGHATVVTVVAVLLLPVLSRRWRAVALALVLLVALARVYVGAHLPLDVVGRAALAVAVAAAVHLVLGRPPVRPSRAPAGAPGRPRTRPPRGSRPTSA